MRALLTGLISGLISSVLVLSACSRAGFEMQTTDAGQRPDATLDATRAGGGVDGVVDEGSDSEQVDGPTDAGVDLLADPLQPFAAPTIVGQGAVSTTNQEDDPTLTADGQELFFEREKEAYVALRTSQGWGSPTKVAELSSTLEESGLEISPDGLRLYFARNVKGSSIFSLFMTVREDRQSPWKTPIELVELNDQDSNNNLTISADRRIVLISRRRVGEGYSIWEARRDASDAAFGKPTLVAELSSTHDELDPWITPDGRRVYFASDRGGDRDIYVSTRQTLAAPFSTPQPLPAPINTAADESDPFLSADERTIHFTRGPKGSSNIFRATR